MKAKIVLLVPGILFSLVTFGQDSTLHSPSKNKVIFKEPQAEIIIHPYQDTRLGSSSPMYNTYEKNNYGAGAITNDPNKGQSGGAPVFIPAVTDTLHITNDSLHKHK